MRCIVSSGMLSQLLGKFDEMERSSIHRVDVGYGKMTIYSKERKVQCEIHESGIGVYDQESVNWNLVYDLVSAMKDQPIIIEVTVGHVRISVDY